MDSTKWVFQFNILLIFFHLLVLFPCFVSSIDTITPNNPIKDGDVLVSGNNKFALGFFSPGNSSNRYVGVWYNQIPEKTVVWVANRDSPLSNTSGILAINADGGLTIHGKNQTRPTWSANVTLSSLENSTAKLLDTGNLVLLESRGGSSSSSQRVLWEGFNYPSDTLLPFMKFGLDRRSRLNWFLTSWKSVDDPGTGSYSLQIDPRGNPQVFLYKDRVPWWRAGTWTGKRWSGVPELARQYFFNVSYVNNQDEITVIDSVLDDSILSRMVVNESGILERSWWHKNQWNKYLSAPVEVCDFYGKCGQNTNCDPNNFDDKFECACLPGFEPKSARDWSLKDGSDGCVRRAGVSICQSGEGFVKVAHVKAPESSMARVNVNMSLETCEKECLRNCSCTAFGNADDLQTGCVTWHGDLMDIRTFSNLGQDLHVRVDAIVLAEYKKKSNGSLGKKGKLAISVALGAVFLLLFPLGCWLAKRKRKDKRTGDAYSFSVTSSKYLEEASHAETDLNDSKMNSGLPFIELSIIARATNNFSVDNKLGEGGFGSVYKGVLHNGKEIAVKRLARNSGQGIGEFKNEVVLIAKLQHKNLVRILGWCVQGEEKMLIYEYLPNKSLDSIIFDETKRALLDWTQRSEIICGIARGLLYLHQDSRLKIIHRDLKAGNVLLDSAMIPKIADFGMARIFGAEQIQANTNRVVGTYGYMAPEYAMEGMFSVKSDVYSFGVLLLEIVTGRKNTAFHRDYPDSNLVVHVWDLWKEGRALEIVDSLLGESYPANEVLRWIQIALLCVQENATDRPTMSAVVFMLGNDAAVPSPRQPGFLLRRSYTNISGGPSASTGGTSYNDVSCTEIEPR